jgi:hypothetical protein
MLEDHIHKTNLLDFYQQFIFRKLIQMHSYDISSILFINLLHFIEEGLFGH